MQSVIATNFETLKSMAGVTIRYMREDESVELTAVIGRTQYEELSLSGLFESSQSRDFLVRADDLKLGGHKITPERGDEIREVVDGEELIYPVVSPRGSRQYEYSDPYRQIIRIHTKQTR